MTLRERIESRTDKTGGHESCWRLGTRKGGVHGHMTVWDSESGKYECAHRLVLEWYSGMSRTEADSLGLQARHLCGHGWCQNPKHLQWGTPQENQEDRVIHGTSNRGERHGHHKIDNRKALLIRALYDSLRRQSNGRVVYGGATKIARLFGVSGKTVSRIGNRRRWSWLPEAIA